jgi:cysteine synthase A
LSGGFVTDVMDTTVYDEIVPVTNEDAFATARRLVREEAIFAGISSGSAAWAALQIAAREENRGKLIVAILPDAGDRYLTNPVYADMPDPDFSDLADALE